VSTPNDSTAPARSGLDLVVRTNMLLPGMYAWVSTVALPAFRRDMSWGPRITAVMALICLVAGPLIALSRERAGRWIGIFGFLALSLATWLWAAPAIAVDQLDAVRAALGGVGFLLFAFGWGIVRPLGRRPEDNPAAITGPPLAARGHLPAFAAVVFAVGVAGALLPLFLAWRVARGPHALMAHGAALLCALALLTASARIAVARDKWRPVTPPLARLESAVGAFTLLALALAVGFVWVLLT
jgi:hypothetical protein